MKPTFVSALFLLAAGTTFAAVIGTNVPATPLTSERVASLPAWKTYLENSQRLRAVDQNYLRAELAARCFGITLLSRELRPPLALATGGGVLGALQQLTRERLAALPEDDAQRARLLSAFSYASLALEGKL